MHYSLNILNKAILIPLSLVFTNHLQDNHGEVIYYTDNGSVEFISTVPLHEFTGKSDHLTGMINFEENIIDFYLDLNSLKTGNERRDRDMYRTLHTDEHPFAEFTGELASPFDENSSEIQNVTVKGEFTLHGITRDKTVEGTLQKHVNGIRLEAEWVQDITDHNIEPPGILFYRVRDEMDVIIEAMLQPTER
ncbi:MAG: YceI family protein [Balneolales bacterium]